MYYKITNEKENHYGFQYQDGPNVLLENFNDNPNESCCPGGFYFTDATNIFKFLNYGVYLREITLPTDNPDFKIIKDKEGDKWRANMIILGKRYDLSNVDTFKYLIELGADIHAEDDLALTYSTKKQHFDVVKYLIENGANVHAEYDFVLQSSAAYGQLDIVKYLIKKGVNVHSGNDRAFRWAAEYGKLDVVKYLLKSGAKVHADNDYAFRFSVANGHLEVHEYLLGIAQPKRLSCLCY